MGASLSNAVAGTIVHWFGYATGFLGLAGIAVVATAILWLGMPETRATTGTTQARHVGVVVAAAR